MTTQEGINLVLSNPKIAQESAAIKASKSAYETQTNALQSNVKRAQDDFDKIFQQLSTSTAITPEMVKAFNAANDNLQKAKSDYSTSQKQWGPAYTGQKMGLSSWGVFTPAGETLTTAQKQIQNPLYNPLYDPGSPEYKSNLVQVSNPNYKPVQMPNSLAPQSTKTPTVNTANLTQAVQSQNQSITPSNPLVKLPEAFQQSINPMPSMIGPTQNQGIKMPGLSKNSGMNTNWNDLFSVAQNRFTR